MKILVTGSKGFIGSNLIPILEKKHKVIEVDLKDGLSIFDPGFENFVSKVDVVIHLAALTSVEKSFKNPEKYYITNVLGTAIVAYLCAKYKKKLIYLSSASIYHRDLSPYANSKGVAEDILVTLKDRLPITILRLFNVYGKGMSKDSGSIMYNFLTSKKLIVYGDGEQTRDYISVKDVVRIIEAAIDKKWNGKIVDVGTGQAYSTNFIAGLFTYYTKKDIGYEPPRREIKWSIANTNELKSLYKSPLVSDIGEDVEELCQTEEK